MSRQLTLFAGQRLQMTESIDLTIASLEAYGSTHEHWTVAWSGGKDSTLLVTLLVWLLETRKVRRPKSLTILYADTRMELLPLWIAAASIREELAERGIPVRVVVAPMDKRFLVYVLGRGVPPPNNNTLRWCTRQIKVDPMRAALDSLGPVLTLTGVRLGESAVRDTRIALSCSRDGGECGQGWYQRDCGGPGRGTLAPILHWRVCHVWEWLKHWAPQPQFGDWSTEALADAYGGEEAEEINARTGCTGCPLASRDTALDTMLRNPRWSYLRPLKGLREVYRWLRLPSQRLRKPGGETRRDGTLVDNQHRMGPITLEARHEALGRVLAIQSEVNDDAARLNRPPVDFLNVEEEARIRELIDAGTWPQRWTGDEPLATEAFEEEGDSLSLGLES